MAKHRYLTDNRNGATKKSFSKYKVKIGPVRPISREEFLNKIK